MRKMIAAAVAISVAAVAVPAVAHYVMQPNEDDELGATLRRFGFLPLPLPTEHMRVGSLYYVDSSVRHFRAICRADEADLRDSLEISRAGGVKETALRNGRFNTNVKVEAGSQVNGDLKNNYEQTVQFSLTDVFVEEVALDRNWEIFRKLMSKASCNNAVMEVIHTGGYVCQGQRMLKATAEFKTDFEIQGGIGTKTKAAADINDVKLAIETQSDQSVVEKQGRLYAGSALKYAVAMNPICMAPPTGRFTRILPESVFGRIKNYLLFRVIEPIWPSRDEVPTMAETSMTRGG